MTTPAGASVEEIHLGILELTGFIREFQCFGRVHMVEFFTGDHFNTLLSAPVRELLESKSIAELRQLLSQQPPPTTDGCRGNASPAAAESGKLCDLDDFMIRASHASLKNLRGGRLLTTPEAVATAHGKSMVRSPPNAESSVDIKSLISTKEYMNRKKAHEIALMSPMINLLCDVTGSRSVVDVGSGKGYLSTYLSLCYGLRVVGVDYQRLNTEGAQERAGKFKEYWSKQLKNKVRRGDVVTF